MYSRYDANDDDDDDDDDDIIINQSELPVKASSFITTYYPSSPILKATKEVGQGISEYEVKLSNMTKLHFDNFGVCNGVDGNTEIPNGVLNEKITSYVSVNYRSAFILYWDLDNRDQSVELSNDVDLVFDLNGNFLYKD